jgi:hypothetical protein
MGVGWLRTNITVVPISAFFLTIDFGPSFPRVGAVSFGGSPLTHCVGARIAMGSGFWAQIVSPKFLPCGGDRILDAQHVSVFSGEDLNRPVRAKHSTDLVLSRYRSHTRIRGSCGFLGVHALQLMSGNERFGHRAGPLNQAILSCYPPCSTLPV